MKKLLPVLFLISCYPFLSAQENCRVRDENPLKLMSAEIKRGIKTFKKLKPPVYYLSYIYEDKDSQFFSVRQQGVVSDASRQSKLSVFARAGSPKMDNTRPLKAADKQSGQSLQVINNVNPFDQDPYAFKMSLCSATQNMAEKAQE